MVVEPPPVTADHDDPLGPVENRALHGDLEVGGVLVGRPSLLGDMPVGVHGLGRSGVEIPDPQVDVEAQCQGLVETRVCRDHPGIIGQIGENASSHGLAARQDHDRAHANDKIVLRASRCLRRRIT
jgi:hypothetical protein